MGSDRIDSPGCPPQRPGGHRWRCPLQAGLRACERCGRITPAPSRANAVDMCRIFSPTVAGAAPAWRRAVTDDRISVFAIEDDRKDFSHRLPVSSRAVARNT